jgi:hypothetical protein
MPSPEEAEPQESKEKVGSATPPEYIKSPPQSHIPSAKFEFVEGVPVRVYAGDQDYEVTYTTHSLGAGDFFNHTVEKDAEGKVTSVVFDNAAARRLIGTLIAQYTWQEVSYLSKASDEEMFSAHAVRPGTRSKLNPRQYFDKLYQEGLLSEISAGKAYNESSQFLRMPQDMLGRMRGRYEALKRKHVNSEPKPGTNPARELHFVENNWYNDKVQEVLEWVESLRKNGSTASISLTRINTITPFTISKVGVKGQSEVDGSDYRVECAVAETVLFASRELGMPIPEYISVYDISKYDDLSEGDFKISPRHLHKSKMSKFLGTSAACGGGVIFLDEVFRRVAVGVGPSPEGGDDEAAHYNNVLIEETLPAVIHETAHVIDSNAPSATLSQSEGFAVSMELGFVFDRVVRFLRDDLRYGREITSGILERAFSLNFEGLTAVEADCTPATFYCWLYEKLGPENFMSFYGHVSGGFYDPNSSDIEREGGWAQRRDKARYQGNLYTCLDALPKDGEYVWSDSRDLVSKYLSDVNKGLGHSHKPVSSLI